jgi:hypothetical protein
MLTFYLLGCVFVALLNLVLLKTKEDFLKNLDTKTKRSVLGFSILMSWVTIALVIKSICFKN